jgi:hypothetical protein
MPPYYDEPNVRFDDPLVRYDDPRTYQEILNSLKKPMFDVILDLNHLSAPEFIQRAKNIKAGIASEAAFATLGTELTALGTEITTLETRQTAQQAGKTALGTLTDDRDDALEAVRNRLNSLGPKVGELATTVAQVEAAQLRVRTPAGPKPIPHQPTGLELTAGDEEGELSGQCEGQPGVVDYYEIRYTTGDPNGANPGWQFAATSKKSRFDLSDLPTGQKVWVQLRACNARGKSPWSDPASKRVP